MADKAAGKGEKILVCKQKAMKLNDLLTELLNFILNSTVADLSKFIVVSIGFFYLFFAFGLWRQVQLMSSVVEVGDTTLLRILSIAHFIAAITAFILAFILL